ncbi:MAG: hypothetical protein FWC09_02465 [Lachnospiraceae bacterium]|nr:hypothetical protein [Lachnospiraceae bacterium]
MEEQSSGIAELHLGEIDDAITHFDNAYKHLLLAKSKIGTIKGKLNSKSWEGDSHRHCIEINDTVLDYWTKLELCDELTKYCRELKDDIENFNLNSTNIEQIGSW